jgi:hypothetical protein
MLETVKIDIIKHVSAEILTTGWMTPSGTNSPPAEETLTTGWMTPSGTNSPQAEETLTSGWMPPSGTNSPPAEEILTTGWMTCIYVLVVSILTLCDGHVFMC